ncbi:flagellin [Pseudooctadecabacter jejudonensis]|uniref:Flagellar hook-associated protein FlgL n=1 Tax=Pseudooctadecabacter jejudonensis TaxID=1391910 RepID=A0A1Y5S4I5_9RHOB|nr:flagellin [Pseudooctadecabacter jejudonensis]SLN32176.1 flagellar hook-associated protein FlgL [Pseudooctadecabacter jejudonensis]
MSFSTLGDMRQSFQINQTSVRLKSQLDTLVSELTSGQKEDLTQHLGVQQSQVTGLDRKLDLLDRFAASNTQTGQTLTAMQSVLSTLEDQRLSASNALLPINVSSTPQQVSTAAQNARLSFEATIEGLNTRLGAQTLFAGTSVNSPALGDPGTILAAINATVAGASTVGEVEARIDAWFDDPAGGFESIAYLGGTENQIKPVDENEDATISLRADDSMVRDLLKALTKGLIVDETSLSLSRAEKQDLQQRAGIDLVSVSADLANTQARLGQIESQVEEASVRIAAQQTSFGMARNDLVQADPFETATRLDALQVQLETHYTLTARLSRLSLTEYLR